MASAAILDFGP